MSINKVIISGNLTRDPELRSTASGMPVLSFGVAVNDRRRNSQTGEWEEVPNYVDCTMFGTRADALSKILTKGQKVALEGKLRWSQWDDRETGKKRSKLEVIVDNLEFMSSRNGGQGNGGYAPSNDSYGANNGGYAAQPQNTYAQPMNSAPVFDASSSVYDEDIPF